MKHHRSYLSPPRFGGVCLFLALFVTLQVSRHLRCADTLLVKSVTFAWPNKSFAIEAQRTLNKNNVMSENTFICQYSSFGNIRKFVFVLILCCLSGRPFFKLLHQYQVLQVLKVFHIWRLMPALKHELVFTSKFNVSLVHTI